MKKINITLVVPTYNGVKRGYLDGCLKNAKAQRCFDTILVFDDGSTDDSCYVARQYADYVMRRSINGYKSRSQLNRWRVLMEEAVKRGADWVYEQSDDVRFATGSGDKIREAVESAEDSGHDLIYIKEANLWRSNYWYRIDNYWGTLWDPGWDRLWKVKPNMTDMMFKLDFPHTPGHQVKDKRNPARSNIVTIHYAYSNYEKIMKKFKSYLDAYNWVPPIPEHMPRANCWQILEEAFMQLLPVESDWFDEKNMPAFEPKPKPITHSELLEVISKKWSRDYLNYFNQIMKSREPWI